MQNRAEQFILLADTQALTDNAGQHRKVTSSVIEVALDNLAAGVDPSRSTIFVQSQVPELAELTSLLLNFVTVAWLERNPTIKEEIRLRRFNRNIPAGFLTYPVSQAADIGAFRATIVPVGDDQLPMIEQTNELIRRFNSSVGTEVLVGCTAQLAAVGRLPGIDGKAKMSESLGNTIALGARPAEITEAVRRMYTDKNHLRASDPGQVEGNVVFSFLDVFEPDIDAVEELKARYRRGGVGDRKVKRRPESRLQAVIAPIRTERERLSTDRGAVMTLLKRGTEKARERAASTLSDVKRALGLTYFDQEFLKVYASLAES